MKKTISLLLAVLTLLSSALVSCGGNTTPPEATESTACVHSAMPEWSFTGTRTCQGQGFHTRTCPDCGVSEEQLLDMAEEEPEYKSLDKKTVMFLGNSFVYYGYCVMEGGQGNADRGYFYQICKNNGESVNVYDYVWGGITLKEIYNEKLNNTKAKQIIAKTDVVFMSEAGQNNAALVTDIQNIMELFPEKTEFYYLNHAYTVSCDHRKIMDSFPTLQKMGVGIVNWGAVAYDVWTGRTKLPGGTLKYNKNSFVVNKQDSHHQNMLSGYLTAQMAYCAYTMRSAQGQDYTIATNKKLNTAFNVNNYISSFYNANTTNLDKILASEPDMRGFQVLMDKYLENEGIMVGKQLIKGEHEYLSESNILSPGDKDCKALSFVKCRYCDSKVLTEVDSTNTESENIMLITKAELEAAGAKDVFNYIKNNNGIVRTVASTGWGRAGVSAFQGTHSACDGSRACINSTKGDVVFIKIADLKAKYDENGKTGTGGKYCALLGYEFTERQTVDTFTIYLDETSALNAFDVLGGKKNADGTITWSVLASCTDMRGKYGAYDLMTSAYSVIFDPAEVDCFQIGIVSGPERSVYISEIELYGKK